MSAEVTMSTYQQRLEALRAWMSLQKLDVFLVPRTDAFGSEYLTPRDEHLAWLTGFTGSAGFCIVTQEKACVFTDGRYSEQVLQECPEALFERISDVSVRPVEWLKKHLQDGIRIGYDGVRLSRSQKRMYDKALADFDAEIAVVGEDPFDTIWSDRPDPQRFPVTARDIALCGEDTTNKIRRVASKLETDGVDAVFISSCDSVAWLMNWRSTDIPFNPLFLSSAVVTAAGDMTLFMEAEGRGELPPLPTNVRLLPLSNMPGHLAEVLGKDDKVQIDPGVVNDAWASLIETLAAKVVEAPDPVVVMKAVKNDAEINGMRDCHLRDGVAVCRLLAWIEEETRQSDHQISELSVIAQLETFRREGQGYLGESFPAIAGSGPHGAVIHYRASEDTNRRLDTNTLFLLDSGGQYQDGTTDVTRTILLGQASDDMRQCHTRVLQGHIAISDAVFPERGTGAQLDSLARMFLWRDGLDYAHGTGHGVGAALCVHEKPIAISKANHVPLEPGMILSNEPGYYRPGEWGIRIENLECVRSAGTEGFLAFETLTFVPLDQSLIDGQLISDRERKWIDAYHQEVWEKLSPLMDATMSAWLKEKTAPLPKPSSQKV